MLVYAGSITDSNGSLNGKGEGIYGYSFDGETLQTVSVTRGKQTTIVRIYGNHLYCTNESKDFTGLNGSGGGITCYEIQAPEGTLKKLNDSISYGSRPSYLSVNKERSLLFVTNHGSHTTVTCHYVKNQEGKWELQRNFDDASLAMFSLNENGSIRQLEDLQIIHGKGYWCEGGGQSTSHLHCVKVKNNQIVCADRGADALEIFTVDNHTLKYVARLSTPFAYAPRHICFDESGQYLYVLYENYPAMSVFREKGNAYEEIQRVKTMPEEYYKSFPLPVYDKPHCSVGERNTCGMADRRRAMPSDIHCVKNHVYVSNRYWAGKGSICCFEKQEDGSLKAMETIETDGHDPRGFTVSSDGSYLFIGVCDTNRIEVYALDTETGKTVRKVCSISSPSPSSVALYY